MARPSRKFSKWSSVYRQFRRWTLAGLWDQIMDALNESGLGPRRPADDRQHRGPRPLRRHSRRPNRRKIPRLHRHHVDPPLAPPFVNMTQVAQWLSMYPRTNCSTANSGPLPSARQRCGPATFCAWRPAAQPQPTVVSRPDLTVLARRGGRVNGSSTYIGSGQRQHGKQRSIVECV